MTVDPLRIYVGASSQEIDRAEAWMAALEAAGLIVTSTWAKTIRIVGDANPRDASKMDRSSWATADITEIADADILWFLAPGKAEYSGRGGYFEAGYAHAIGKAVVVSGDVLQSIFNALHDEYLNDSDAFDRAVKLNEAHLADGAHLRAGVGTLMFGDG